MAILHLRFMGSTQSWCIAGPSRTLWIELCQRAGTGPHDLVSWNIDSVMKIVLEASLMDTTKLSVFFCKIWTHDDDCTRLVLRMLVTAVSVRLRLYVLKLFCPG